MKSSVLIVEDEAAARDALARALSSHGHPVRTAADSQQAIKLLGEEPADAVLLDLDLPHVPGDSLAAFLRIRYPKARIIFMSGQYDMVDPERFGANAVYFRKPLDIEEIVETLEAEEIENGK